MNSSFLLSLILLAASAQLPGAAGPPSNPSAPSSTAALSGVNSAPSPAIDRAFALAAAENTHAELVMAQLALSRSRSDAVRAFARQMISEQSGLAQQLTPQLRRVYRGAVPSDLSAGDILTYYRLAHATSVAFDETYALAQVGGHVSAFGAFETESVDGSDPQLKAVVRRWTPTIESHLEKAIDLMQHVGGSPMGGSQ
jgi:putative membrane protein